MGLEAVMLTHPSSRVRIETAGLNVSLWVTGYFNSLPEDCYLGVESSLGLAKPPLERLGRGRMNVIVYQLALVSRERSGSLGTEAYACGSVCSLSEVVARRLIGLFLSKHSGG